MKGENGPLPSAFPPPSGGQNPRGPWTGFASQVLAVVAATAVAFSLLFMLFLGIGQLVWSSDPLMGRGTLIQLLPFVFICSLFVGAIPSAAAAASLRAWRNVIPTSPIRIAGWFSLALAVNWACAIALSWGKSAPGVPPSDAWVPTPGTIDGLWPFHLGVGILCGAFAWTCTKNKRVAGLGATAGLLASWIPMSIIVQISPLGTMTCFLVAFLCSSAFAGAWMYGRAEKAHAQYAQVSP